MPSTTSLQLQFLAGSLAMLLCGHAHAAKFGRGSQLPMEQNQNLNLDAVSAGAADANGDGRIDVVFFVAGFGGAVSTDHEFYVYEQRPDGSMALANRQTYAPNNVVAYRPKGMAFADLDHDNRAEIIVSTGNNNLAVLKRGADGLYKEAVRIPCPFAASMIRVADLDGDGHVEILMQSSNVGLAVYKGNGSLAYANPTYVLSYAEGIFQLADVNADSRPDILSIAQYRRGTLGINRGTPYAFFAEPERIAAAPANPLAVAFGKFDSRWPGGELAVLHDEWVTGSNNTVFVYQVIKTFADGPTGYVQTSSKRYEELGSIVWANSMLASDLDDDGDDDLVVFRGWGIEILFSVEGGVFDAPYVLTHTTQDSSGRQPDLTSTHIADFNGDGCKDLGAANRSYTIYYRIDCPDKGLVSGTGTRAPASLRLTPARARISEPKRGRPTR